MLAQKVTTGVSEVVPYQALPRRQKAAVRLPTLHYHIFTKRVQEGKVDRPHPV